MVLTQRLNNYTIKTLRSTGITEKTICPKRQKVIDIETKYCYNRNKLANNVTSKRCKNTTKKISKVVDEGAERRYNRNMLRSNGAF